LKIHLEGFGVRAPAAIRLDLKVMMQPMRGYARGQHPPSDLSTQKDHFLKNYLLPERLLCRHCIRLINSWRSLSQANERSTGNSESIQTPPLFDNNFDGTLINEIARKDPDTFQKVHKS
jgi:hypothetical protein